MRKSRAVLHFFDSSAPEFTAACPNAARRKREMFCKKVIVRWVGK